MKIFMKWKLLSLLLLLVVFSTVLSLKVKASNIQVTEGKENISLDGSVKELSLTPVSGKVLSFEVTKLGRLEIKFSSTLGATEVSVFKVPDSDLPQNILDQLDYRIREQYKKKEVFNYKLGYGTPEKPYEVKQSMVLNPGKYEILVFSENYTGTVKVSLKFSELNLDEIEPNDDVNKATKIEKGKIYRGFSEKINFESCDYYEFVLDKKQNVVFHLEEYEERIGVVLLNQYQDPISTFSESDIYHNDDYELIKNGTHRYDNNEPLKSRKTVELDPGKYYIKVSGDYSLEKDFYNLSFSTIDVPVTEIKLEGESEVFEGSTFFVKAMISPSNASFKDIKWSVSNENLAQISQDGFLHVFKEGEIDVIATAFDGSGVEARLSIKIKEKPKTKKITHNIPKTLIAGKSLKIKVGFKPAHSEKDYILVTNNPDTAIIKGNELIGLKKGTAEIEIKDNWNVKTLKKVKAKVVVDKKDKAAYKKLKKLRNEKRIEYLSAKEVYFSLAIGDTFNIKNLINGDVDLSKIRVINLYPGTLREMGNGDFKIVGDNNGVLGLISTDGETVIYNYITIGVYKHF